MLIPTPLMRVLMVLIGISLGSVVMPETLHGIGDLPAQHRGSGAGDHSHQGIGGTYLRVVHGWDTLTAYLAAAPGGLSQVMGLAAELDADMRAIAIVQTMRVADHRGRLAGGLVAVRPGRPRPRAASAAPFDPCATR